MNIFRRWARRYAAARRRQEKIRPENLLPRWDRACQRKWDRFHQMPPGEPALRWLERSGNRLRRIRPTFRMSVTCEFVSALKQTLLP